MRRTVFFIVALLGIEGSLSACKPSKPEGATSSDKTLNLFEDPTGSTGHNGLIPDIYHNNKLTINDSTNDTLLFLGKLSTAFDALVLPPLLPPPKQPSVDTKMLADYTISCAVPDATVTLDSAGNSFSAGSAYITSKSLLNNTTGWPGAKLDLATQEDLHACLATRLNPLGATVNIWLGGAHVTDDKVKPSDYAIDEALWATIVDPGSKQSPPKINLYVWPSQTVSERCSNARGALTIDSAGVTAVTKRACGTLSGTKCGIDVRTDTCTQDTMTHFWNCPHPTVPGSSLPAIHTKINCDAWCSLYPDCKLPDHCVCQPSTDASP